MAYGICGLTGGEFRSMTPAEFDVVLQARLKDRERDRKELYRVLDAINCRNCEIVLSAAGAKNVDPNEFRTITEDEETTEESDDVKARRFEEFMKRQTLTYRPPKGDA